MIFSLQEQAVEDKQRRSAAAAKEKIMAADGNGGEPSTNNNAATSTEISEHENEVQNDNWPRSLHQVQLLPRHPRELQPGMDGFISHVFQFEFD